MPDNNNNWKFLSLVFVGLLACQAALYLRMDPLFYALTLISGGIYLARRSHDALWVGFIVLAVTSQINPVEIDELGTSIQGAYRPYILVVAVIAFSMFVGQWFRPSRTYSQYCSKLTRSTRWRIGAFVAVLFLAVAYGYFSSMTEHGLQDIVRECSGWLTLMMFLFLGYRLEPSAAETQGALVKFRLAVLAYSAFFVFKFIYLSSSLGADETAAGFGYSQRDLAFFSGLVLVLLIAQTLTSAVVRPWKGVCLAGMVLLLAVLLSGSRSIIACVVLVTLLLALFWHSKTRLTLAFLGMAIILALLFGSSLVLPSEGGVLSYVSDRFLTVSTEDTSLLAHASEFLAVADAVRENPLLGKGPLASYTFFDPLFGWKETTFLDSGLGYLLMKTGLLGTCVFIWFAVGWLKMAQSLRGTFPGLGVAFLASFVFYFVFLLFGPSFFEFQHSWFIGIVVGYTMVVASKVPMTVPIQVPRSAALPGALA